MPTIRADGLEIAYVVEGAGPPLIGLHGATGAGADHYATLLPALRGAFRVHLPDARGHAGTRWDARDGWTALDLVDDVVALADGLGLASFHLIGYSMGGMTALQVAARLPGRVRTLVAVSIAPEREPRRSVGRRLLDPERIAREDAGWARRLAERHDLEPGDGRWQRLLAAVVADLDTQPLLSPQDLRRIDAPTLVVAGDRDPFVPVEQARALARQVRDGRLLILPGIDHEALTDRSGVLTAALADFYRSTAVVAERRAATAQPIDDARKETP
jgi:pimeloyl-ACP methyl ester carboxylesterase